jgi:large subunit ribosomal protein L21
MEFAIIKTGGKQYKVAPGDSLKIEKIKYPKDAPVKVGDPIIFDEIMLVEGSKMSVVGTPTVPGVKVHATLEQIGHNKTVTVVKYKQKSRYFKKNGHRQPWFKVKIDAIK